MISVLAVKEQQSINKIGREIGLYLSAVQRIEEWAMIRAKEIMNSDSCEYVKFLNLHKNKDNRKKAIKALL